MRLRARPISEQIDDRRFSNEDPQHRVRLTLNSCHCPRRRAGASSIAHSSTRYPLIAAHAIIKGAANSRNGHSASTLLTLTVRTYSSVSDSSGRITRLLGEQCAVACALLPLPGLNAPCECTGSPHPARYASARFPNAIVRVGCHPRSYLQASRHAPHRRRHGAPVPRRQ